MTSLKAKRVVASVDVKNVASAKVLDKCMIFERTQYNEQEQCLDRLYYYEAIKIAE